MFARLCAVPVSTASHGRYVFGVAILFIIAVVTQSANFGPTTDGAKGRLATALQLALAPMYLNATGDQPQLTPSVTAILQALLESVDAPLSAEHWQSSPTSLNSLQGLARSGRAIFLSEPFARPPHTQRQIQHQAQQHQQLRQLVSGDLDHSATEADLSSWLTFAERTLAAVPEGPSYPLLRRVVVALLLQGWIATGPQVWREARS